MKVKSLILICLGGLVVFSLVGDHSWAKSESSVSGLTIGVVSVRKVFETCKRNEKYRKIAAAEQERIIVELQKLRAEIEAAKAGLQTLKEGSKEHLELIKDVFTKQAQVQAQEEFYKQQIALKDQRWYEALYADIIEETGKVAQRKALTAVFEKDEIDLPAANINELMLAIRTHKLLYNGGCLDITDEVIAKLDAKE